MGQRVSCVIHASLTVALTKGQAEEQQAGARGLLHRGIQRPVPAPNPFLAMGVACGPDGTADGASAQIAFDISILLNVYLDPATSALLTLATTFHKTVVIFLAIGEV